MLSIWLSSKFGHLIGIELNYPFPSFTEPLEFSELNLWNNTSLK